MTEHSIEIKEGESKRLLTAGKYCDRDIVVSSPAIGDAYKFVKIADNFECVRAVKTIDIKSYEWWESVALENIYCVIRNVKSTAAGTFPKNATCGPIVSYSNGTISLNRGAIDGSLVVSFFLDVYIALPL